MSEKRRTTDKVGVRLDADMAARLNAASRRQNLTRASVARTALAEYLGSDEVTVRRRKVHVSQKRLPQVIVRAIEFTTTLVQVHTVALHIARHLKEAGVDEDVLRQVQQMTSDVHKMKEAILDDDQVDACASIRGTQPR